MDGLRGGGARYAGDEASGEFLRGGGGGFVGGLDCFRG